MRRAVLHGYDSGRDRAASHRTPPHAVLQANPADALAMEGAAVVSKEDLRFVERLHTLRSIGLGLGFLCVVGVLRQNGAHPLVWTALAFNGLAWPHLAYAIARRSSEPQKAELRNLFIDSTCGGAWIALMQFNLVPSALFVAMLSMDKISVAGWRFVLRTAAGQAAACLAVAALNGFRFTPDSSTPEVLFCLPFLLAYPLAISSATFALTGKVRRQNKLLQELNRGDPLTGLLNRTHWESAAMNELTRHQRLGRPAALLMVDIDRFKPINDLQGHPAGDEVIRGVAALIGAALRDIDVAGRYGGDEFGVVLPDADLQQALAAAERIRAGVGSAGFGPDGRMHCTVSIGLALAAPDMQGSRDWIARADQALYRAKTRGRNCVEAQALRPAG
jgi:diguanylate cyclase